jgi:modification methylase
MFMIAYLLGKPQYNRAQRCLMAIQLEKEITKLAAKNKGRRKLWDESSCYFKSINTIKELSKIANVGEQFIKQFRRILKDGSKYFNNEQYEDYMSQILREATSTNAVYRKLTDKIKTEKKKNDFMNNNKSILNDTKDKGNKSSQNKKTIYENPYYEDNNFHNKIVCEDNVKALSKIPSNSVNLIFGSPPYNVHKVSYHVDIPVVNHNEYIQQIVDVAKEAYRIARHGGRFVINIAPTYSYEQDIYETFIVSDIVSAFEKKNIGWKKRNVIIWNKRCSFQRHPKGSVSAENPCFITNHEYLVVFSKGDYKATPQIENAPSDLTRAEFYKWGTSVWNIVPQSKGKGDHPCPFPNSLVERVIRTLSFVGDVVVDPWLGSGTVTAEAARLGRRWFGCDISTKYCAHAAERTEKAHKEFLSQMKTAKPEPKPAA